MPARRLGLLVAALLLGLLLGLPPVTGAGAGAEKTGVCPALEVDVNCTKECLSDAECADNLKCCPAGCAAVCQMPNGRGGWNQISPCSPSLGPEKKGSCPQIDLAFPQLGFCVNKCQEDSQCPSNMKCCLNGCGKMSCVTPVF